MADPKRNRDGTKQDATRKDRPAPKSFLDTDWSWSSPSSWPLSIRLLPLPIAFVGLFIGVYIQAIFYSDPPPSAYETCQRHFDFNLPMSKIHALARDLATHDWEIGIAAEAFLELHNPDQSVFAAGLSSPNGSSNIPKTGILAMQYVLPKIRLDRPTLSNNTWGVSDPASLGVFAAMAGQTDERFKEAASRQADYLLTSAPRYANGAISHRTEVAELWSDAVHMFPPFLAYYGQYAQDHQIINQALQQIKLYRDVLMISEGEAKGLWRHIVGPSDMADAGAWSTGNGWAAYGMMRVRATISERVALEGGILWEMLAMEERTIELIEAAIRTDTDTSGLLRNYLNDETWFGETSGTALIAAAAFRLGSFTRHRPLMGQQAEQIPKILEWAEKKAIRVFKHIDEQGIAKPAVNPLKHGQREPLDGPSPEGQSFVLLLAAARRDYWCSEYLEEDSVTWANDGL